LQLAYLASWQLSQREKLEDWERLKGLSYEIGSYLCPIYNKANWGD